MNEQILKNSENEIIQTVNTVIPDFKSMIDKAKNEGVKEILMHQDTFAADYQVDEIVLLGKAVKYAGLNGISLIFHGVNRETLK